MRVDGRAQLFLLLLLYVDKDKSPVLKKGYYYYNHGFFLKTQTYLKPCIYLFNELKYK